MATFLTVLIVSNRDTIINQDIVAISQKTEKTIEPRICDKSNYKVLEHTTFTEEQEDIRNEIFYGELEEVALVVQAEAGNQDELGKRYVADCVFNRVDSVDFPDNIHDVVYQLNPVQFSTTVDGGIEKAAYTITEDVFQIVLEEFETRTNSEIIYFRTGHYSSDGTPAFPYGDHYFSTR